MEPVPARGRQATAAAEAAECPLDDPRAIY